MSDKDQLMRPMTVMLLLSVLVVAGCAGRPQFGQRPQVTTPGTVVNAPVRIVRDVITDSARRRGTAITLVGDGLILEAPLAETRIEVAEICGPHRPGRKTRVVLTTVPEGRGTLLSEDRYIVDGAQTCYLRLSPEDAAQSRHALNRIKATAEEIQRRISAHAALQ
ncbi:MAG: hypothetical protein BVN31_05875 [Proteobacteria bacterium ST_bin15]|nr:MAG: hypothetical protein BVN31_05875 [Proteobacteria bacterium ST_bin15]